MHTITPQTTQLKKIKIENNENRKTGCSHHLPHSQVKIKKIKEGKKTQ